MVIVEESIYRESIEAMNTKQAFSLGWREWLSLPQLGIDRIKAKIDTGARTSALHAFFVTPFQQNGQEWVRFGMHPYQGDLDREIICEAAVVDRRIVTDSGGHKEERFVIRTAVVMAQQSFEIDMTLTNRDTMKFRMLLGRTGIPVGVRVYPEKSFLLGEH